MKLSKVMTALRDELAQALPQYLVVLGAREPYDAQRFPCLIVACVAGRDEIADRVDDVVLLAAVRDSVSENLTAKLYDARDDVLDAIVKTSTADAWLDVTSWTFHDGAHTEGSVSVVAITATLKNYKAMCEEEKQ